MAMNPARRSVMVGIVIIAVAGMAMTHVLRMIEKRFESRRAAVTAAPRTC